MAYPYTPGHVTDAQIEKMAEQIRLLSEEVIRLRGQLTVHPQPLHDVLVCDLPPQP